MATSKVSQLRRHGLVVITAKDAALARAAGGKAVEGAEGYYTTPLIANAIHVVRQVAFRTGRKPIEIMRRLNEGKYVAAVGRFVETGELDTLEVNGSLAQIFGLSLVMGPIRCNPDGTYDIAMVENEWEPATDELLRTLDSELRLGAPRTMPRMAAEIILQWKNKENKEDDNGKA